MKKRILYSMLGAVIATALVFTFVVQLVQMNFLSRQIESELERSVRQLGVAMDRDSDPLGYLQALADSGFEERITLIAADGSVLLDSRSDPGQMENHLDRAEIQLAAEQGVGSSMRFSPTQGRLTYYCAVRLSDGSYLRLSEGHGSDTGMFFGLTWWLLAALLLVSLGAVLLANHLTKKIVQPINSMDLTAPESNQLYPELQPLIQRMAELNRREFTANVAHELKTPLTSIVGYAEIMKQHVAPERDWPELVEYIYAEGKRMIHLVEDILLISRLDGGSARNHCEIIELKSVAEEVAERFRPMAEAAQVELKLEIEAARIFSTRQIAEEILSNLIDNAIKYNREGGSVCVEARETGSETLLTVRDTGIGISHEDQPRIFERFFRVDKSRSKATGGTGLGLSIVKHAVQLLGGSIDLESEPNVGTAITVHFPWQAGPAAGCLSAFESNESLSP